MSIKNQLRVLVVDDMSTSRGLISQSLDEIGIKNYFTENDGETAWRSMISRPVHLVLSDYNMPKMDGLQLLHAIRSHQAIARTGFILITGRADQELIDRGVKLGMNNFVKKPFQTKQLKETIEKVVGRL